MTIQPVHQEMLPMVVLKIDPCLEWNVSQYTIRID